MKTKLSLKKLLVAIKDPEYLKYQKKSKSLVQISEQLIKGKKGKFDKADDSDNFKFPYYEGELKGKDMKLFFDNPDILWFPQYYILYGILEKCLNDDQINKWQEEDFDWTNEECERENFSSVDFKKDKFEIMLMLSSIEKNFMVYGIFKSNQIEVKIKEM